MIELINRSDDLEDDFVCEMSLEDSVPDLLVSVSFSKSIERSRVALFGLSSIVEESSMADLVRLILAGISSSLDFRFVPLDVAGAFNVFAVSDTCNNDFGEGVTSSYDKSKIKIIQTIFEIKFIISCPKSSSHTRSIRFKLYVLTTHGLICFQCT